MCSSRASFSSISLCLVVVIKSDERLAPFFHLFFFFCPSAGASSTETAQGTLCTSTKRPRDSGTLYLLSPPPALLHLAHFPCPNLPFPICSLLSAAGSESEATPEKRPRTDEKEGGGEEARGTPKQKNRRRCYRCQTKLELVQQELGSCRCGQYQHAGHVTR